MTLHTYSDTERNRPNTREGVLRESSVSPRGKREAIHGADASCSPSTVTAERTLPTAGLPLSGWPSIIDLTIAAPRLASRISDWLVLEVITLSDHRCIEFTLEQRCQAVEKGRVGEGRSPSWNTRRLSRERLRENLEETRLIDELGWVCPAGSFEATVRSARQKGGRGLRLLDASP